MIYLYNEWQQHVISAINRKHNFEFVKPHYEKYSIVNLASTIASYFHKNTKRAPAIYDEPVKQTLEGSDTVVFFFLDGFGNALVKPAQKGDNYISRVLRSSYYAPITTVFPSTTTTALASANTGLFPEQHGIIGHTMYLKKFGTVASLISFSPVAEVQKGGLISAGLDPRELMSGNTIYEELNGSAISSAVLTKMPYGSSGLTRMIHSGAEIHIYNTPSDMLVRLRKMIENKEHHLIFAYWDAIDIAAHLYGAGEDEVLAEVRSFFYTMTAELFRRLDRQIAKKTSFFMTGDHGHITVPTQKKIIANDYPNFLDSLQLPPAGDSRACFIKINDDAKVKRFFRRLAGKIDLIPIDRAIKDGYFGKGEMNKETLEALGDYLILSKKNYAFHYRYRRREEFDLVGYHGGMSEAEMIVPMIFGKFSS